MPLLYSASMKKASSCILGGVLGFLLAWGFVGMNVLASLSPEDPSSILLFGQYDHTLHTSFILGTLPDGWCLDQKDPQLTASVQTGSVVISGATHARRLYQTGISACDAIITSPKSIELAVVVDCVYRETCFVLEFYSLDIGCALAQLRCNTEGFALDVVESPCPSPNVYREGFHVALTESRSARDVAMHLIYDAQNSTIRGYVGQHLLGQAALRWHPDDIMVRIFVESAPDYRGAVHTRLEQLDLGWDLEG
jgi:hypothetical protein